jgi:Domain of unknown function (DUF4124)
VRLIGYLVFLFVAINVHAEVYKWKDSEGKVHYSDKPNSAKSEKIKGLNVKNEGQSQTTKPDNTQASSNVTVGKNAAYCGDLLRRMEYNKKGGLLIIVEKQAGTGNLSYRQATQDTRKKNLDIIQSELNKYCEENQKSHDNK